MRKVYSKLPPLSDEAKAMLDKAVAQPEAQRVEQEAKERIANLPPTGEEPAIVLKS